MTELTPIFSSEFEVPDEGDYLFMVESIEFVEDEKGLSARVRNVIQDSIQHGGTSNEMVVFDNFPLYVEFGKKRFLGFLVKSINIPFKKYPEKYLEDKKVQARIEKELPGSIFGGRVKHVEGRRGTMANIVEVYTKDEYNKKLKDAGGKPKEVEKAAPSQAEDEW